MDEKQIYYIVYLNDKVIYKGDKSQWLGAHDLLVKQNPKSRIETTKVVEESIKLTIP